jgi:hypothetical protein
MNVGKKNPKTDLWKRIGTDSSGSKCSHSRGKIQPIACWFVHSEQSLRKNTPSYRNVDQEHVHITELDSRNKRLMKASK